MNADGWNGLCCTGNVNNNNGNWNLISKLSCTFDLFDQFDFSLSFLLFLYASNQSPCRSRHCISKIIVCDFSHLFLWNPFNRLQLLIIAGNCIVWWLVCAIITTLFMPCWMVDQDKNEWRYINCAYAHNLVYFVNGSTDSKD